MGHAIRCHDQAHPDNACPSGVPKVILARLLFGLGGCALICALFPFVVTSIRWMRPIGTLHTVNSLIFLQHVFQALTILPCTTAIHDLQLFDCRSLLVVIVALGLVSAIAFSSRYPYPCPLCLTLQHVCTAPGQLMKKKSISNVAATS